MRDRIKEFRRVPSAELIANPKNWREHPPEQRKALQGVLDEVGIAGALLARETGNGLELIDGHLRSEIDAATDWPVLVLDVDEREADILLASVDPIAALAKTNNDQLQSLLGEIEIDDKNLNSLLDGLEKDILKQQEADERYSAKIESPVYEIKGERPDTSELFDEARTQALIDAVNEADIDSVTKQFLVAAARRHTVFSYDKIAEFYAHASADVQDLMEDSALVIIDFDKAVEHGFVKLTGDLAKAYEDDHAE